MKSNARALFYMLFFTGIILLLFLIMQILQVIQFQNYLSVLFPKGLIGIQQRDLLLIIQALMLLVVIPVYIFTFIFSWKYRAGNKKASYDPHLTDNWIAECFWWGIPLIMTLFISVITWIKTIELDPYKAIASDEKPITIQAVALQWKWLFIYPEEKIAVVNFLQIPKNVPIRFEITSDAPMNSFWIPALGGQIYAMPAMRTELNLIANQTGDFRGSSANISGEGFAGMHFIARASSKEDYDAWIADIKKSEKNLEMKSYRVIAKPTQNNPVAFFKLEDDQLFNNIIMQYMHPKYE